MRLCCPAVLLIFCALGWSAPAPALPVFRFLYEVCLAGLSGLVTHAPLSPAEREVHREAEWRSFLGKTSSWYAKDGSYRGPGAIAKAELPVNFPQVLARHVGDWEKKLPPGTRLDPQVMTATIYDLRDFTHDPRRFFRASQSLLNRIEARAFEKKIPLGQAFAEIAREVAVEGGFPPEIAVALDVSTSGFRDRLEDGKFFYDATLKKTSYHGASYHLWQWLAYIQDRRDASALPPPGHLRAAYMALGHRRVIDELQWGDPRKGEDAFSKLSPWYHVFDTERGKGFFHPEIGNLWLRAGIRGMTDVLDARPY